MNDKKLGPTGKFPQGKLTKDDEGEIKMAVGVRDGKIIIDFGHAVTWFGMDKESAKNFANLILNKCSGETLNFDDDEAITINIQRYKEGDEKGTGIREAVTGLEFNRAQIGDIEFLTQKFKRMLKELSNYKKEGGKSDKDN